MHEGDEITTIEGLGSAGALHPMQAAFVECDGYQCGYCTSGQIMSAVALLKEPCGPDDADVKEADERQHLPLRRLPQHRRRDPAGARQSLSEQELTWNSSSSSGARDVPRRDRGRRAVADRAAGRRRALPRRRHDAARPDEAERRDARRSSIDINRLPLDKIEATARRRAEDRRDWCAIPTSRTMPLIATRLSACCRRRCSPARRRSCATWRRPAATCCSARAACTSATPRCPATSASPARGCSAIDGHNRTLAILGTSEHCIATNPSDMNVALAALEATVHVQGAKGDARDPDRRLSSAARRHAAARDRARAGRPDHARHAAAARARAASSLYLKLRDRASYEFALASAAVVVDGRRRQARRTCASRWAASAPSRGARPKPRPRSIGQRRDDASFRTAAEAALARREAAERERLQGRTGQALPRARAASSPPRPLESHRRSALMPTPRSTSPLSVDRHSRRASMGR